jgi:hypothetical protein
MKKVKIILISCSIFFAIGTVVATDPKKCLLCEYYPQYRNFNGVYMNAGTLGIDYICTDEGTTCTYYKPWPSSPYTPCQPGTYLPLY